MLWKIILVLLCVLLMIFLLSYSDSRELEDYTSNSHHRSDKYIDIWNKELFLPVCDIKINYLVSYHTITKFTYAKDSVNIILDGEPMDLSEIQANVAISTKKERLPPIPQVYVPYFVYSFLEKGIDPELLVKKPDDLIEKTKFCCFMYSNCREEMDGVRNRKRFLELMNKMTGNRVDNLGQCYNNNYKDNGNWTAADEIYEPYKFVIAFENQQITGYITEKLVMPMLARAIPIYLGASDVKQYFNHKSFINVNDFPNFESCIEYVMKVDKDESLYRSIMSEPYFNVGNRIDKDMFSLYYGGRFYHELYNVLRPYGLKEFIRPCKFYTNNIRFITFADGKKYKTDRIIKEAEESGFFKECEAYDPRDFDSNFRKKHWNYIKKKKQYIDIYDKTFENRGFGYWVWKPYIILKAMENLEYGDYLIWCDSGNTINPKGYKRMKELFFLLERYDIVTFRLKYEETTWSKMDSILAVLQAMGKNHDDLHTSLTTDRKQKTSAILLLKKTEVSLEMLRVWSNLANDYHLIDDSPSIEPNIPEFKEHRHDQSLLSLVTRFTINTVSVDDNWNDSKTDYTSQDGNKKPIIVSRKKN